MPSVYHGNNARQLVEQLSLFEQHLPRKPYHTDSLEAGLVIRGATRAKLSRYIQANGPTHKRWLAFDVDHAGAALSWHQRLAPPPTLVVENPKNGHAHLLYALETPVRVAYDGKAAPLRYAAAVESGIRALLDADFGYSGLICKNPLHNDWNVYTYGSEYTLGLLAEYIDTKTAANDPQKPLQRDSAYGLGRNCTLFDELRFWAYKAIRQGWSEGFDRWLLAVQQRATALNLQFTSPLPSKEVSAVAKSVAKWTYQHFTQRSFDLYVAETHTPEIQAIRGKKSGAKRRIGTALEAEPKPWIALGISRATWYRRQQRG